MNHSISVTTAKVAILFAIHLLTSTTGFAMLPSSVRHERNEDGTQSNGRYLPRRLEEEPLAEPEPASPLSAQTDRVLEGSSPSREIVQSQQPVIYQHMVLGGEHNQEERRSILTLLRYHTEDDGAEIQDEMFSRTVDHLFRRTGEWRYDDAVLVSYPLVQAYIDVEGEREDIGPPQPDRTEPLAHEGDPQEAEFVSQVHEEGRTLKTFRIPILWTRGDGSTYTTTVGEEQSYPHQFRITSWHHDVGRHISYPFTECFIEVEGGQQERVRAPELTTDGQSHQLIDQSTEFLGQENRNDRVIKNFRRTTCWEKPDGHRYTEIENDTESYRLQYRVTGWRHDDISHASYPFKEGFIDIEGGQQEIIIPAQLRENALFARPHQPTIQAEECLGQENRNEYTFKTIRTHTQWTRHDGTSYSTDTRQERAYPHQPRRIRWEHDDAAHTSSPVNEYFIDVGGQLETVIQAQVETAGARGHQQEVQPIETIQETRESETIRTFRVPTLWTRADGTSYTTDRIVVKTYPHQRRHIRWEHDDVTHSSCHFLEYFIEAGGQTEIVRMLEERSDYQEDIQLPYPYSQETRDRNVYTISRTKTVWTRGNGSTYEEYEDTLDIAPIPTPPEPAPIGDPGEESGESPVYQNGKFSTTGPLIYNNYRHLLNDSHKDKHDHKVPEIKAKKIQPHLKIFVSQQTSIPQKNIGKVSVVTGGKKVRLGHDLWIRGDFHFSYKTRK